MNVYIYANQLFQRKLLLNCNIWGMPFAGFQMVLYLLTGVVWASGCLPINWESKYLFSQTYFLPWEVLLINSQKSKKLGSLCYISFKSLYNIVPTCANLTLTTSSEEARSYQDWNFKGVLTLYTWLTHDKCKRFTMIINGF